VRRRPLRKIEQHFVDVTPAPPFRGIIGLDDRVLGGAKMFCGMSVGRLIAATDMTATAADTQMQPGVAQFQAFFTPQSAWKNVADLREMFTEYCHAVRPRCLSPRPGTSRGEVLRWLRPSKLDRPQASKLSRHWRGVHEG
jgi:hypothetical protein